LFVYFTVRDKAYLYYVGYIIVVGLVQLCLLGYTFEYLWPDSTWLASHSVYLLSALIGIAAIEFIKVFLQTKTQAPKLHKWFHVLNAIYISYIVLDFFNLSDEAYNIIQGCAMILSFYMLFVAYVIMKKGYHPAKFFLMAWSIFLVGVFIYALKDVGVLPYNAFTIYTMPVGSAIEATLLSFALADKINTLRKEKEDSNAKALLLLTENERIVREQNINLEIKVKERTAELEASTKSLKEAEAHLINVEKMASLGQLTAGISHEINNPINFVTANIKPLKRDIGEILQILSKYGEIKDENGLQNKLEEISELKARLDSDYLIEEIDLLLKGIDEGASRTSEIVKGLKNFSRSDDAASKVCDLHHEMDATLAILNNSLVSGKIKVLKQYNAQPQIECYPGKINQVFMNVFNNAIQAIATKGLPEGEGIISVSTETAGDHIVIRVKDNGIGIPSKNQNKIFEPFFTTKPVGMGTGLGLSIVYGIIKSHNGDIKIESEEGKGAEFIITLPIQLNK
ncbi:MAG: 7TM diverse intracellular signaling domain-containing protein, partial [Bacteroidia bacterium]